MNSIVRIPDKKGAALIALVAAILLFSILAAAIVPMISSSSHQGVATNLTAKAYLLAESGYRYAASEFLHAGDGSERDQNEKLEKLGGDYKLSNELECFKLEVYPYFYVLDNEVNGGTQFDARVPGNFPAKGKNPNDPKDFVEIDKDLKLKIGSETYTLKSGKVNRSDDGTVKVTFNVEDDKPLARFPNGTPVYPVAYVNPSIPENTTINEGGNLTYVSRSGRMFPLYNGNIQVNGRILTYRYNNREANQFVDVRAADQSPLVDFDSTEDPEIVLTRYVRLHATGIYKSGDLQIQRRVVYYTPLPSPESSSHQEEFSDYFDTKDTRIWRDISGTTVPQDNVLKVTSAPPVSIPGEDVKGALTTFRSAESAGNIDFGASYRGTRGYLSYDTQIKVGYENAPTPSLGFFPPATAIPAYVCAGLSFRLGGEAALFSNNSYGISFLRGNDAEKDGIPDDLVPPQLQDERALVLWRQTGIQGSDRTWLAYKKLADLLLDEDNEDAETGNNAFQRDDGDTNLWVHGASGRQRAGSTRNWYFERTDDGEEKQDRGSIESDAELPAGAPKITLTFWSWHENEPAGASRQIRISDSSDNALITYTIGGSNAPVALQGPDDDGWYQYEINLTDYAGERITIQFEFDTVDEIADSYKGWYIDDIQLPFNWPSQYLQEATVALSIKEAMVVPFKKGSAQIYKGDRIHGANTKGTVLIPPLIRSGNWGEGEGAGGTLLLNSTTVVNKEDPYFQAGEDLIINGPIGYAKFDDERWNSANDKKADIIQVYLATKNGRGSGGNDNPLDGNTAPYGRIGLSTTALTELQWPPVLDDSRNWTDSEDYFQLIEWDAKNSDKTDLSFHAFTTTEQGVVERAILQSHHVDLETPAYPGIYEDPEVGLHSMGDGADNVYFDDFGIRLNVFETDILPSPIQQ